MTSGRRPITFCPQKSHGCCVGHEWRVRELVSAEGETSVDGSGLFCKEGTLEKNEKIKSYMGLQESGETVYTLFMQIWCLV